jgi:DNA-binding HxlR family transcriptional regulator
MRKATSTNSQNRLSLGEACVLNDALARLALRWKMPVLHAIASGTSSYGELRAKLPEISHQMLASRLRELVAEGLAVKVSGDDARAPRYAVTNAAREVLAIMEEICRWEKRHGRGETGPHRRASS